MKLAALLSLALMACTQAPADPEGHRSGGKADDVGSAAGPVCGISCATTDDCPVSEPYCNQDLGQCQATPPQCVTDADCADGDSCHRDGYCWFFAPHNCRPGWGWFEGECDNAACEQDACPAGTTIDPETCFCNPEGDPPRCETQRDCSDAYPYCNRDSGSCQQTPPECVTDADCAEGDSCHSDGYCWFFAPHNCRPGWGWFEGECDNAACDQEQCPAGTRLDEATCFCEPVCGP